MTVYIVLRYHAGYETSIVGVYATQRLAEDACERFGMADHGWERYEVHGL